jgi:hypothetical protein
MLNLKGEQFKSRVIGLLKEDNRLAGVTPLSAPFGDRLSASFQASVRSTRFAGIAAKTTRKPRAGEGNAF